MRRIGSKSHERRSIKYGQAIAIHCKWARTEAPELSRAEECNIVHSRVEAALSENASDGYPDIEEAAFVWIFLGPSAVSRVSALAISG
jgi:hypothetical protein